ncbi:MAG TPA: transglutaminaseTgpA domain-containing protein [Candidatus Deferrimicrobiaceae bacterium]|jgi:transglutaminase-like putative cysteine protease
MIARLRGRLRPPRRLKTTREGKWFLALTLGVGIAAVNTGNNLLYIVLSANLSIVLVSGFLSEMTLRGARVAVSQPAEAFAGREGLLAVTCTVPPSRRFPALSLDVAFRIDGEPLSARMPDAAPGTMSARVLTFRPRRRGIHPIDAVAVSTRFPFALFEKSLEPAAPDLVIVFPEPVRAAEIGFPAGVNASAESRPGGRGTGAGIRGVRDYAHGDPARDIQWKATARLGRRMVKERESERAGLLEIRVPDGIAGPAFERAVSGACGDVLRCEREGIGYRIHHAGRIAVDGTREGARKEALRFLCEVAPGPAKAAPRSAAGGGPRKPHGPLPGGDALTRETRDLLWWIPRIFWGSGLLMLFAAGVPWPFVAGAAAAFSAGLAMELGALPPLRGRGLETLLGGIVCLLAAADFLLGGRDPLRSGALLVLGIQSIRFLLPKRVSDGWQLTAVTFLEYLAAAATESGPRFALAAAAFLLLCPGAMWSHHARNRAEAGGPAAPVSPRFAATLLLGIALAGIAMSALLFTVTPRLRVGHLSRKSPATRKTIGFSDTLSMHDMSGAASDTRVAARIDFPGGEGGPPGGERYLKGASWSIFTGGQWRKGGESPALVPRVGINYFLAPPSAGTDPVEAVITLEPLDSAALFVYGSPVSAEGPLGNLRVDRFGNLLLSSPDRPAIRYRLRFMPAPVPPSGVFSPPSDADRRNPADELPEIAALSAEVAPPGLPPEARARRLVAFLQAGYRYTIEGSAEGIRDFLFVRKAGYCEHFATALCLLLRASGIPAHVAAGYLGGEWNEIGNYLIVRQMNAHAWTEAWIGGRWVTLDATPAGRSEGVAARQKASRGEKYLDWLRHGWDRYVVDYDLAMQAKGVEAIGAAFKRLPAAGRGALPRAARTPVAVAILATAGAGILLWRLRRRAGRRADEASAGGEPLPAPYARLFRMLARNGWKRNPGTSPAGMLAAATAGRPELADDRARFCALYHRDRFGAAPLPAGLRAEALALADRLRLALSRETAR